MTEQTESQREGVWAHSYQLASGQTQQHQLGHTRVWITLLVAYGSDIDEVKILLKSIALANDNVQNSPEPRVRFREFAESGIKLQLLFWIYKPEIRGRTVDAVNTQIYKQFATNNITIPYPTMKVLLPENSK